MDQRLGVMGCEFRHDVGTMILALLGSQVCWGPSIWLREVPESWQRVCAQWCMLPLCWHVSMCTEVRVVIVLLCECTGVHVAK